AVSVDRLVRELSAASPWLAWTAAILAGLAVLALLVLILRELAAVARLRRVEALRRAEAAARVGGSVPQAREVCARLRALYAGRRDVAVDWRRLAEQADDAMDAGARIALYERRVLEPLDAEARAAVRQAARRVSIVTALAPSLLLDAAAALYLNAAMIRRLAEIYGGRAGLAGTIRLARRVVAHAMAMGLIALTDDMLEPLLGGGVAAKVSRRLGEGVVNGAMTARLGLAAMEVCRPLAFEALPKPSLREVMWDALRKR
ncbi:MAG: TIGR01620 family protein, partial [Pseudomonadota bacterium]